MRLNVGTSLRQEMQSGCEDYEPFIDAYIDEEFGDRDRAEMEVHLSHCDCCRKRVQAQLEFKEHLRVHLCQEKAPEDLKSRLLVELEDLEVEREDERGRVIRLGWMVGPIAAMVALAFVIPAEFTVAPAASSQMPVIDQTVDWHRGNFPLEVTTADPVEAREWFSDKVDFSVRLPQFADRRVNLLGGRIAHVEDRRAALLLYEVDGAKLSVILFEGDGLTVPKERVRRLHDRDIVWLNQKGYGVAVLQDSGVTYAMTSDLSEERFLDLVATSIQR